MKKKSVISQPEQYIRLTIKQLALICRYHVEAISKMPNHVCSCNSFFFAGQQHFSFLEAWLMVIS